MKLVYTGAVKKKGNQYVCFVVVVIVCGNLYQMSMPAILVLVYTRESLKTRQKVYFFVLSVK